MVLKSFDDPRGPKSMTILREHQTKRIWVLFYDMVQKAAFSYKSLYGQHDNKFNGNHKNFSHRVDFVESHSNINSAIHI